jgi:hypothetical protein
MPTITLGPGESPVSLDGGVLRVVLGSGGHTVNIAKSADAATLDVTLDTGEMFQFDAAEVLRMNVYGGNGDDRFIFDPTISLPIYLDGGAGENSVKGWPAHHTAAVASKIIDHCAQMSGMAPKGSLSEAVGIQHYETDGVASLATAALAGHGAHGLARMSFGANSASVVTGGHAMMLSGLSGNAGQRDSMMSGSMGMHSGGKIAPELMIRTSTNSQVGGQVAYHKPG